ncbi:hypothetical protein FOZ60_000904 [Perkinsus olseni]|uniref:Uncharacterized protein n=1 Tax=Perkinsus olseni TaxID=32597 RepID=A0A7J6P1J7_PEROL|nr:hypothetical protein FOZ60_000904 [Perkinsus olseni]
MLINRPSPVVYRLVAAASRRAVANISVSTHRVGQQDRRPPPPKVLPPPPPPPRKALIPIPQLIDSMTEAIQNGKNEEARNIAAAVVERRTEMAGSVGWSDITVLMWGLCALKEQRMMTELVEGLGIDTLMRECPPIELGMAEGGAAEVDVEVLGYSQSDSGNFLEEGSVFFGQELAEIWGREMNKFVEKRFLKVSSLLVALRVFTDRDFAERKETDCTTELDWGLLVPALRALSSREALEKISTDDLINCLLGTGIARSFEVVPEVLGVFLKTAAERLGMTDEALSLEDRAKVYRAACRNILVDNEDAARARESVAANFDDGKVLAQFICRPAIAQAVERETARLKSAVI